MQTGGLTVLYSLLSRPETCSLPRSACSDPAPPRAGADHNGADYVAAWAKLELCRQAWNAAVAGFDAVLTPTAPILPPNIARLETDHEFYVQSNLLALRNTRIGNLMGVSGLSLPTCVPSCGLQLWGLPNREEALLRIGAATEAALA